MSDESLWQRRAYYSGKTLIDYGEFIWEQMEYDVIEGSNRTDFLERMQFLYQLELRRHLMTLGLLTAANLYKRDEIILKQIG